MISRAGNVGCTIDQSVPIALQKPVSMAAPLQRPVQVTEEQVKDTKILAKQLSSLQQEMAETTRASRSHPFQSPIVFPNVPCHTLGTKVTLAHNLGRFAYWMVIGWRGASTTVAPVLIGDQLDASDVLTDENTISLRSYAAGTCDLMVF